MPICRQVGHWAKDCTNCDKSPKTDFYKYHKLGYWKAILPGDPRASRSSATPSLTMVQQDWSGPLQPAHLSQITFRGLEPRVHWIWQVGLRISCFTQGLPNLSWPPSPPKPVPFGVLQINNYKKIHPSTSLLLGRTNIFPPVSGGPWVSYSFIGKRPISAFEILQLFQSR